MNISNSKTSIYNFSFLSPYQAQKEILVNENINKIDLLLNRCVLSFSKDITIDKLNYGDLAIIPKNQVDLQHYSEHLILKTDEIEYIKPKDGMLFWATAEQTLVVYTQKSWKKLL